MNGMNGKIGIGIILVVVIALLLLSGMLGRLIGLALSLAVWGSSGYLAGKLLQGRGYGLLGNILLGMAGGFVGSLLVTIFGITGLVKLPFIGGILVGALGAVLLVVLAGLLTSSEPGESD